MIQAFNTKLSESEGMYIFEIKDDNKIPGSKIMSSSPFLEKQINDMFLQFAKDYYKAYVSESE